MNSRIVVGVDDADNCLTALDEAVAEAALRGLPLCVLHADPFVHSLSVPVDQRPSASGVWALDRAVQRARAAEPAVEVTGELVRSLPQRALIQAADDAALVVIGDRGLNAVQRIFVDTIAGGLATHAACPVRIARGTTAPDGPVVVGIDGPAGSAAVGYAFAAADLRGVGLVAVHAWTRPAPDDTARHRPLVFADDAIRDGAERLVAEALAGWPERYPDVPVRRMTRHGHPSAVLVEASTGASQLVVGIRGHGLVTEMGFGSLSTRLLRRAPVSVVVVPEGREDA